MKSKYKSDRTEGHQPPSDFTIIKTLCSKCFCKLDCKMPRRMTFGGIPCAPEEYMANALRSDSVYFFCDNCLESMPDVNVEDMILDESRLN